MKELSEGRDGSTVPLQAYNVRPIGRSLSTTSSTERRQTWSHSNHWLLEARVTQAVRRGQIVKPSVFAMKTSFKTGAATITVTLLPGYWARRQRRIASWLAGAGMVAGGTLYAMWSVRHLILAAMAITGSGMLLLVLVNAARGHRSACTGLHCADCPGRKG